MNPERPRRSRSTSVFVVLACVSTWIASASPPTFVGLRQPPYPADCKAVEGAVLGPDPPYRFGYEHLVCGDKHFVVLQRLIEFRDGKPVWEVVDEAQPSIGPGQELWGPL